MFAKNCCLTTYIEYVKLTVIIFYNNMITKMIKELVENFELTDKEAQVYLANLKKGKSKVSDIAKEANLNRITTYEILKRLFQKGLASGITYNKLTYFKVIDPELFLLKKERQISLMKNFLPRLKILKNSKIKKPKIDFYTGKEGIKVIYEDTLKSKNKVIYNVTNIDNLVKTLGQDFLNDYFKKRTKRKIRVQVLVPEESFNKKLLNNSKKFLREFKIFNSKKYQIPNELMIYDDKVAILSFSGQVGVLIEDEEITQSIYTIWKIMWDNL